MLETDEQQKLLEAEMQRMKENPLLSSVICQIITMGELLSDPTTFDECGYVATEDGSVIFGTFSPKYGGGGIFDQFHSGGEFGVRSFEISPETLVLATKAKNIETGGNK